MELLLSAQVWRQLDVIGHKPGGSYLFVGPQGVGKFTAAYQLALKLCGDRRHIIVVEPAKRSIGIDQIHELNHHLGLKAASNHRVVIVREAGDMTLEAQNAFLKLLEEPPSDSTIILVAKEQSRLLPTILSRCQRIRFSPISSEQVQAWLVQHQKLAQAVAAKIAQLCHGAIGLAIDLANDQGKLREQKMIARRVQEILKEPLYQKLMLVPKLLDDYQPSILIERMVTVLRQRLRVLANRRQPSAAKKTHRQLVACARMLRYLEANGNPKLALDSLAMELV